MQEDLQKLLDKAAEKCGSKSKLARAMGVSPQRVNDWYSGAVNCVPEDRARLAGFAREDALQELVRATLEKTAGTLRGEQLRKLLGKSLPQIIAGIVFALLLGANLTYGSFDAGALVAFFAFWLYSTMYIKTVFLMRRQSDFVAS